MEKYCTDRAGEGLERVHLDDNRARAEIGTIVDAMVACCLLSSILSWMDQSNYLNVFVLWSDLYRHGCLS